METAIDLVVGMVADWLGCSPATAQYQINEHTQAGVQNLYVTRFFCEILK